MTTSSATPARQPAGAPTGGQFAATAHPEAAVELASAAAPVHEFYSSGEGYNQTQWDDSIKDGDVLAVPREGVYGFLYEAWPVAVPNTRGEFHAVTDWDAFLAEHPQYEAPAAQARALAAAAATPKAAPAPMVSPEVFDRMQALDPTAHLNDLAGRVTSAELDSAHDRLRQLRHHSVDDIVTTAAKSFDPANRAEAELVLRRLAKEPSQYSVAVALAERVRLARLAAHGRR